MMSRLDSVPFAGINGKGKLARVIFTHLVCTKKSAVLGVQQNRLALDHALPQTGVLWSPE